MAKRVYAFVVDVDSDADGHDAIDIDAAREQIGDGTADIYNDYPIQED